MFTYNDLNDDQKLAYDHIMAQIPERPYDADERILGEVHELLLEGFAGSGKTTLASVVITELKRRGYRVFGCAPTHQAAQQLKKAYEESGIQLDFIGTIHSALGLKLEPDEDSQKLVDSGQPKTSSKNPFSHRIEYKCDILVFDEVSMASDTMHEKLLNRQKLDRFHILHIGDEYQLEPPDSTEGSPIFQITNKARLTKVTRQAEGSPIIQFSADCRGKIDYFEGRSKENKPFSFDSHVNGKEIQKIRTSQIVDKYLELIGNDPSNATNNRVLAFTNERVDALNRVIRKRLLGPDAAEFVNGEILILQDPTKSFYNNQEVLVTEVCEDVVTVEAPHLIDEKGNITKYIENEFDAFQIKIEMPDDPEYCERIYVFGQASRESFDIWMGKLARHYAKMKREGNKRGSAAGWREWWNLKGRFPGTRPAFASTVHKAQGCTMNDVIFDLGTTMPFFKVNPSTAWRLVYVAATRPRNTFYFAV